MPVIRLKFFSIYSDATGSDEVIEVPVNTSLSKLLKIVVSKYPVLDKLFKRVKPIILVNGSRINDNYIVKDGDEIAFIPPASGG